MIIHLNGLPGVGKLTVARELMRLLAAQRMPACLVDNHLIHNIPLALTQRETPEYWDLFRRTRDLVYQEIIKLPKGHVIVMTNSLVDGIATNDEQIHAIQALVDARGDSFHPVLLLCDVTENQKRIQNPERLLNRKLLSPKKVAEYHARLRPWHASGGLAYDITKATPDYVAGKIMAAAFSPSNS